MSITNAAESGTPTFDPGTLDFLAGTSNATIALVRCEREDLLFPGTQSESVVAHVTIVKTGIGLSAGQCSFRFFNGPRLRMQSGSHYLVAAHGAGRSEVDLDERLPVTDTNAEAALTLALNQYMSRRK